MAKIANATFTGSTAISIDAGNYRVVRIPTIPEGRVARLIVYQASGAACAFKVDLIDKAIIAVGQGSAAFPANIDLYRIIDQQSVTSGNKLKIFDTDEGRLFINGDGDATVRVRAIYLIISPTASAVTTTWDACVVVESFFAS